MDGFEYTKNHLHGMLTVRYIVSSKLGDCQLKLGKAKCVEGHEEHVTLAILANKMLAKGAPSI